MLGLSNIFIKCLLLSFIVLAAISVAEEIFFYSNFYLKIHNLVGPQELVFNARGLTITEDFLVLVFCPLSICILVVFHEWLKDCFRVRVYRSLAMGIAVLPLLTILALCLLFKPGVLMPALSYSALVTLAAYVTIYHVRFHVRQVLILVTFLNIYLFLSLTSMNRVKRSIADCLQGKALGKTGRGRRLINNKKVLIYIGEAGGFHLYFEPGSKSTLVCRNPLTDSAPEI